MSLRYLWATILFFIIGVAIAIIIIQIRDAYLSSKLTNNYGAPRVVSSTLLGLVASVKVDVKDQQVDSTKNWFAQHGFLSVSYETSTPIVAGDTGQGFIDFEGTQEQILNIFHKELNSYCGELTVTLPIPSELSSTVELIFQEPCAHPA